jgi:hypothetical protein
MPRPAAQNSVAVRVRLLAQRVMSSVIARTTAKIETASVLKSPAALPFAVGLQRVDPRHDEGHQAQAHGRQHRDADVCADLLGERVLREAEQQQKAHEVGAVEGGSAHHQAPATPQQPLKLGRALNRRPVPLLLTHQSLS